MKQRKKAHVTILIVAKNEAEGIKKIISSVRPFADEILLVDGHSTDNTKEIAKKEKVTFFEDHGKGRGDGVRVGFARAKGDVIVCFVADGSHEAKDIPKIIKPLIKNQADLVICSRRKGGSFDAQITVSGMLRSFGSDLLAYIVNKRFGTQFTDIIFSFRAIKAETARNLDLTSNGFTIEQEMVVKGLKKGVRIVELPSREKARGWGVSKLKTIAGMKLLFHIMKECFVDE